MDETKVTPEAVTTLYEFLQGEVPYGMQISKSATPKLSAEQAEEVIDFLRKPCGDPSEQYERCDVIPDHYRLCDFCGKIYDSWGEGIYFDPESLETESGRPLPKRLHNKFGCGNCLEFRIHGEFRDKQ